MSLILLDLSEAKRALPRPAGAAPASSRSLVRVVEAATPNIFYGQDPQGYRRISQTTSGRDLTPPMQWRMQQVAYFLYLTNPLAKRIVEHLRNYVVGEGFQIIADDPAVQEVAERFWNDPFNRMRHTLREAVLELSIFGEQLWAVQSNPITGAVQMGTVDPSWIDGIEYATLEAVPGKAVGPPRFVLLRKSAEERKAQRLAIMRREDDLYSEGYGELRGECFYWAINKVHAASRGVSDLFALSDWIDGYDQMLFSVMNRVDSLSRFIWDVLLKGTSEDEIGEWLKKHGASPRPNSVRAHNENETWSAVAPQMQGADLSEIIRVIKNFSLGGAGLPEHWFADGAATNRATALEQGEPTLKMLTERQDFVLEMGERVIEYAIDRAVATGMLPEGINRKFTLKAPELSVRDMQKAAAALQGAAQGLSLAQSSGIMDTETAVKVLAMMITQLGVQVDADDLLARVRLEEAADYARRPASAAFGQPSGNPPPDQQSAAGPGEKNNVAA